MERVMGEKCVQLCREEKGTRRKIYALRLFVSLIRFRGNFNSTLRRNIGVSRTFFFFFPSL